MRCIVFVLFVVGILFVPALRAQNVPGEPVRPSVNLTAEQRHIVRENVLTSPDLKREGAEIQLSVGAAVPAGISVQEFPPLVKDKVPQVRPHRFFVKGNTVVIVNPSNNTIADVIE